MERILPWLSTKNSHMNADWRKLSIIGKRFLLSRQSIVLHPTASDSGEELEEVANWNENNHSTNGPISDSDVQNVEVKMEEISDWEEYNHGAKRLFPLVLHSQRECQRECVIKNSLAPWYNQEY